MKKLCKPIAIVLVLVMALAVFTGCGEAKQAETALTNLLNALKAGDFNQAKQYMNIEKLTVNQNDIITQDDGSVAKLILKNLDFKIASSKLNDDGTVTVKAEISTPDMKAVLKEFTANSAKQVLVNSVAGNSVPEEERMKEAYDIFAKSLSKENLPKVTNEIEVTMKKAEADWKAQVTDRLADTVLGDAASTLKEYINAIN